MIEITDVSYCEQSVKMIKERGDDDVPRTLAWIE